MSGTQPLMNPHNKELVLAQIAKEVKNTIGGRIHSISERTDTGLHIKLSDEEIERILKGTQQKYQRWYDDVHVRVLVMLHRWCENCKRRDDEHSNLKCLFASTTYLPSDYHFTYGPDGVLNWAYSIEFLEDRGEEYWNG